MCIKNCHQKDVELVYYGREVCQKHYFEHCDKKINLKQEFNITEV